MKTISPELTDHLGGPVTTLATCWRLRRRDGVVVALTAHDRDLVIDGTRYRAAGGFTPTAIAGSDDLAVDNLDVTAALSSASLDGDDLREGRFDRAHVEIFLVNWQALGAGRLILRTGYLGDVSVAGGQFTAEVRGLAQALQHTVGEVYSPECRADLGDGRCKVGLHGFAHDGRVTGVIGPAAFTDTTIARPAGWFDHGSIRWHTGANAGLAMEIKAFDGTVLTLVQAMTHAIAPGDLFTATAGCDKRLATCRDKFDNVENFRGEPFVPGLDAVLDYPGLG